VPALIDLMNSLVDEGRAHEILTEQGENWFLANDKLQAAAHAQATAEREAAEATDEHTAAMEAAGEVAEILAVDYDKLLGGIKSMQSETDRYTEAQDEANAAIEEANKEYAAGNLTADEWSASLIDNQAKLDANAAAHKRWAAETVLAFAQAKAAADGNITEGEGQILIDMGVQLGLFDQKTADVMENVNSAFDSVDTENAQSVIDALKKQLEQLTGEPWTIRINTETGGSPPSGPYTGPHATGGAFDAGAPMLVHKDEILVPDYGGVVLTRTDAMKLMQGNGGGNGGGKTFVNYGSMTIVVQGGVMDVLDELS